MIFFHDALAASFRDLIEEKSSELSLSRGINFPVCSVLGSLLFLVFIMDIPLANSLNKSYSALYLLMTWALYSFLLEKN